MNEKIKLDDAAPDFTLPDQNGEVTKPTELKGKKVLLSFHPLAWTGICAMQMKALDDNFERLEKLNVMPLGISVDTVPSKKAWAENLELKQLRLLSDFRPHGQVAERYGIFLEKDGISGRANFIMDESGKIIFARSYQLSELPDIEEVVRFLKSEG